MSSFEPQEYVAFVDDETQELENYRYSVEACDEEEARLNAQAAFPYGIVRSVHRKRELDELDLLQERAAIKREIGHTEALRGLHALGLPDAAIDALTRRDDLK